jgi:uncharacterized membrane protein
MSNNLWPSNEKNPNQGSDLTKILLFALGIIVLGFISPGLLFVGSVVGMIAWVFFAIASH